MSEKQPNSSPNPAHLPTEPIQRVTEPFARFFQIEAASGVILLLFTMVALFLSNSPWATPFLNSWEIEAGLSFGAFEWTRSLKDWINDALLTLFFFVVALELKRELVLGELRESRLAALSIAAAVGGMVAPALLYLMLQLGHPGEPGWGTVMSTDTAFVVACLALLGSRVPPSLRVFLLSLVVVDDIGAILVVAIGYSHHFNWFALVLGILGLILVRVFSLLGVRSIPIYVLIGGWVWIALDASGIHGTVTGVILGLLTPATPWISDRRLHAVMERVTAFPLGKHWSGKPKDRKLLHTAEIAARETLSPVERLEFALHPWVSFAIMPLFAFANAGIVISVESFNDPTVIAITLGLVLGKPIGIVGFSWLAVRLGIASRPSDLSWGVLAASGLLAGIGFTMALFIADLAFDESLLQSAKLGILAASAISATTGLLLLAWLLPCAKAIHPEEHSPLSG
jgi:NhaA family Na+:H+ antiporter